MPYEDSVCAMYIRASYSDGTDIDAVAKKIFGKINMIARTSSDKNEAAFITEEMTVKKFNALADELEKSGVKIESRIRMGDL